MGVEPTCYARHTADWFRRTDLAPARASFLGDSTTNEPRSCQAQFHCDGPHGSNAGIHTLLERHSEPDSVEAVADAERLKHVILFGNSLGGPAPVEAALLKPGRLLGVVVDTFQSLDDQMSPEEMRKKLIFFSEAWQRAESSGGDPRFP